MKLSKLASLPLCLLLACAAARPCGAQEPRPKEQPFVDELCPVITIECPDVAGIPGSRLTFKAKVMGLGPKVSPSFTWEVSAGSIEYGQGTTAIIVDTTGVAGGSLVTAILKVGGLGRSCSAEAACSTAILQPPIREKIDFYGAIPFEHEQALLDNLAIELQNDTVAHGYIVCYGGRRGYKGEAKARCERAKRYLVNRRNIAPGRVILIDGGFMEELSVWLWLLPPGTKFTPTPTVDPKDVEFIRKPSARGRRGRRALRHT